MSDVELVEDPEPEVDLGIEIISESEAKLIELKLLRLSLSRNIFKMYKSVFG